MTWTGVSLLVFITKMDSVLLNPSAALYIYMYIVNVQIPVLSEVEQ